MQGCLFDMRDLPVFTMTDTTLVLSGLNAMPLCSSFHPSLALSNCSRFLFACPLSLLLEQFPLLSYPLVAHGLWLQGCAAGRSSAAFALRLLVLGSPLTRGTLQWCPTGTPSELGP